MNLTKNKVTLSIIMLTLHINCQANVFHWLSQPESSTGALINGDIGDPKISANGRYVSFFSFATNLVEGDTNGLTDLFIKDLQTGEVTRVNTTSSGQQITDYGINAFSAPTSDGQWIAFSSWSSQLPEGAGFADEYLYLKNLQTGVVTNHSDVGDGTYFEIRSDDIYLSDDAQAITFSTSNQIDPNVNTNTQVYRKFVDTNTFELISVATDGIDGVNDFGLDLGDVSDNGRYVVFSSGADNLVSDTLNNTGENVYLRDTQTDMTSLINRTPAGNSSATTDSSINQMTVSNAGQVAFVTSQGDLVTGDNNNNDDLFLLNNGTISRINLSPNGTELSDGVPYGLAISGNGTTLVFRDKSTGLVTPIIDDLYFDLFKYDLNSELITQISLGLNNQPANFETFSHAALSTDGSRIVFTSGASNLTTEPVSQNQDSLYYLNTNNNQLLHIGDAAFDPMTTDAGSYFPSISSDQMTVVYASDATNLTSQLVPGNRNLYLLNRQTNTHEIIGRKVFTISQISPSGRFVLFSSEYFQPAGELHLDGSYLFLYDRANGSYTQIEEGLRGQVSDNGLVVFDTEKSLDSNDQNGTDDVYLFLPATQDIQLVSKNSTGQAVNGYSPDIGGSGNNTWITFGSISDELVPADTNGMGDVFMKKWPNGVFIRASATVSGVEADGNSYIPFISADTTRVVFTSSAQNLTPEDYTHAGDEQLIMYDRISQTHHLVTRNDAGLPIPSNNPHIYFYDISNTGRYVAFEYEDEGSSSEVDYQGDEDGREDVLLFDLDNQSTQIISQYLNGNNSTNGSVRPQVVEDLSQNPPLLGVIFESAGGDLTGRIDHPGRFVEIILYQQGGDDVTLSIIVDGPGTVNGNAGINCTMVCDQDFSLGTDLDLVASPEGGMMFSGWQVDFGGCNDDTNPCQLIMDRSKTITALFIDPSDVIFIDDFE